MAERNHQIVRAFIQAMSDGAIDGKLVTDDFKVWILGTPGLVEREAYAAGIALLPQVFPDKLAFTIHSLTAEDDRVVAQFSGVGTTLEGETYRNDYLYLFRIRDGKVSFLAEYLNLDAMRGTLIPAMAALPKDERITP
jgi:ketosteroid isomerase-like protein